MTVCVSVEALTMIRGQHDYGAVGQLQMVQSAQKMTNLGVHIGNRGKVVLAYFPLQISKEKTE